MQLVIAEKPSVGRDLARVLGATKNLRSHFEGNGWVVTWCVGHLVELDEPKAYDARWQAWRMDTLPMLPAEFRLRPSKHGADQLKVVAGLLREPRFVAVVNACDAGREGELIFRYVYQYAQGRAPIKRLWISSLTDDAIKRGFAELKPGSQYEALADAARSRSEADWLVGLNATRAVTLRGRTGGGQAGDALLSIGRVQTPTLAMLVARDAAIKQFVPRDYWEVQGAFTTGEARTFTARWTAGRATQLATSALADEIVGRCAAQGKAADVQGPRVAKVKGKTVKEPPPQLFDLTSLQRTANRRFGFSAQRTLDLAQVLYERHKVLSYPRTDSRYLSTDVAKELGKIFSALATIPEYRPFAQSLLTTPPSPSKRFVDDSKVSDHHAIIPIAAPRGTLERDEQRLFDLVARRFLGAFFPDAEFAVTTALVRVGKPGGKAPALDDKASKKDDAEAEQPKLVETLPPPPDWFVARGRVRLSPGWQTVAGIGEADAKADDGEATAAVLPPLVEGQALDGAFAPQKKQTSPPRPYTEATLLSAMEGAGKALTDDELRAAMKDTGLGTPATRASIIETLLKRGYVVRDKKQIVATAAGCALIDALPVQSLASPELTGEWEARLARIARQQETRGAFMADIARYVQESVAAIRGGGGADRGSRVADRGSLAQVDEPPLRELLCPRCKLGHLMAGKRGWGCDRWRDGCAFVVWYEADGQKLTERDLRAMLRREAPRI